MSKTDHHLRGKARRQRREEQEARLSNGTSGWRESFAKPRPRTLPERVIIQEHLAAMIDADAMAQNLGQDCESVFFEREFEALYDQEPYADWECDLLGLPRGTQHSTTTHDRNDTEHLRICSDCSWLWAEDERERQDVMEYASTGYGHEEMDDEDDYDEPDTTMTPFLPIVTWQDMADAMHLLPGEQPVFVGPTMTRPRIHPAGPGAIPAYDLARRVGVSTSDLIAHMRSNGEHVQNANSLIPKPVADAFWGHVLEASITSIFTTV